MSLFSINGISEKLCDLLYSKDKPTSNVTVANKDDNFTIEDLKKISADKEIEKTLKETKEALEKLDSNIIQSKPTTKTTNQPMITGYAPSAVPPNYNFSGQSIPILNTGIVMNTGISTGTLNANGEIELLTPKLKDLIFQLMDGVENFDLAAQNEALGKLKSHFAEEEGEVEDDKMNDKKVKKEDANNIVPFPLMVSGAISMVGTGNPIIPTYGTSGNFLGKGSKKTP